MENKEIEKKKELEKLGVMRIVAVAILGFMIYWVFSDMELEKMEIRLVPMLYVMDQDLYLSKKMMVLLVPILFNLALWIPRYAGYVLIRSVIYTEGIKYIILAGYYILGSMAGVFFAAVFFKSEILLAVIMVFYLWALKVSDKILKTEKYRKYFKVGEQTEKKIKLMALIAVIALYAGVYGGLAIESKYGMEEREEQAAKVTTYDKIELTKKTPYGKSFIEVETYSKWKISPDGKKLLLTHEGKTNQSVEIYDIESGKLLKKFEVPNIKNVYLLPDKKYILFTKFNPKQEKINKFEVRNIETSEIDTRFRDENKLLDRGDDTAVAYNVKVSPEGKYFAILSDGIEVWDYQAGKLLDYYDVKKGHGYEGAVAWLSENKFLTAHEITDGNGHLQDKEIFINEIMPDGTVKKSKQKSLAKQMKNLGILDGYIYGVRQGREILIVKGENGAFGRHTTWANLLDVETGHVKFSLRLYNWATVLFDDKTDTLVAAEDLKSGKRKITVWSIEPKEQKKVLYADVDKWEEGYLPNAAELVAQGKKLVYLMKNKIQFVDLE